MKALEGSWCEVRWEEKEGWGPGPRPEGFPLCFAAIQQISAEADWGLSIAGDMEMGQTQVLPSRSPPPPGHYPGGQDVLGFGGGG